MATKTFKVPSTKYVRFVVYGSIALGIYLIYAFNSLSGVTAADSRTGWVGLGFLQKALYTAPLSGLVWLVLAGHGRRHVRGYYIRHRYAQVLAWTLFFCGTSIGTNIGLTGILGWARTATTSYAEVHTAWAMSTFLMFIPYGLVASVIALPIIIWKSKKIEVQPVRRPAPVHAKPQQAISKPPPTVVKPPPSKPSASSSPPKSTENRSTEVEKKKEVSPPKKSPEPEKHPIDMTDDDFYAIAWREVEEGNQDEGLWARMFVENDGDENRTKVSYLKLRVEEFKIQLKNEIEVDAKRLEVAELQRRAREEEEKRRRTANEAREKREAEEEEKLLIRLRNTQPSSGWKRDDYIGNYVLLKNAVKETNGDQTLRLIRSGADPTAIPTDTDTGVQLGLSSNTYLRNMITVSVRLRNKGILTLDGLVEK